MKNALSGIERALFWTLAFASFAAAAAGLCARAVDHVALDYEQQRDNYAIVRVIAPEGAEGIALAEAALDQAPHVNSAAPMTPSQAAALLREWGGADVAAEEMPPLRLIEIELAPSGDSLDVSGDIVASLAQGGVTAELVEAPDQASGGGLSNLVRAGALWGATAFGAVMALIVWLAARGLAARRRELVTVMTDLGATGAQAAGRIADEAATLGLQAGLAGAGLAGVAAIIVIWLAIPATSLDTLPAMILPIDLVPLAVAPLGAALAAGAGARAAAGYFHRQAARLG
jgi:cell division transport system permease protein